MKKRLSLFLCLCLMFPLLLCRASAQETAVQVENPGYYQRFQGQNISINVYNWGEYISDGSDDSLNVNQAFEELTGIKVVYSTFASNEELYAKLKGGGVKYDVIIPSDYMIARMIAEDMLEELNLRNIPNFSKIGEKFQYPQYDPQNRYSVPYTWGTVGIIYNKEYVDEEDAKSWDILWDERYLGNILMFSNSRDSFGIALKKLGYSFNTTNEEEIREAAQALKEQKPLVVYGRSDNQGGGRLAPYYGCLSYDGNREGLRCKEGTNIFTDAACIPKGAKQKEAAEMYLNFLLESQVAAANCDYIGYSTPQDEALQLLEQEVRENPVAYPADEVLDKAEAFLYLPQSVNDLYDKLWTETLSTDQRYNAWFIPILLLVCVAASITITVVRSVKKRRQSGY
ncbi:MAG: ABC transporter substrate-binding protein [Oscillospiraceae bacterium]